MQQTKTIFHIFYQIYWFYSHLIISRTQLKFAPIFKGHVLGGFSLIHVAEQNLCPVSLVLTIYVCGDVNNSV